MLLSLVVPCYNEEGNVTRFYSETERVFRGEVENYEIVFVDDGSRDCTLSEIEALHKAHDTVRGISFSRNFGKEAAMLAGLREARGDLVCLIDADLQQRPEVVLQMLSEMKNDPSLDCVAAYQEKRNEGKFISFLKSSFYKIINKISDVRFVNGASDFRLMKRPMVDAIISLTEYHRFTKGIFGYVGFNTKFIPFTHEKREIGTTKWGFVKLFKYAFHGILAFSTAPLKIPMVAGVISLLASAIIAMVNLIGYGGFYNFGGTRALIWVVALLVCGVQLVALGVVAEYLSKMYIQTKNRPIYFVRQRLDQPKKMAGEEDKMADEADKMADEAEKMLTEIAENNEAESYD